MKKHILTTTLLLAAFAGMAQVKTVPGKTPQPIPPTFKTPLSQQDIQQQFGTLQVISQKLHTVHMDGLLRDSLDNLIGRSAQMLSTRYREAFVADSLVNVNFKKEP